MASGSMCLLGIPEYKSTAQMFLYCIPGLPNLFLAGSHRNPFLLSVRLDSFLSSAFPSDLALWHKGLFVFCGISLSQEAPQGHQDQVSGLIAHLELVPLFTKCDDYVLTAGYCTVQ